MTLVLSAPDLGLVAADTRFTYPDGHHDLGDKIRRLPHGWAGGTGNAAVLLLGLRTLETLGASDLALMRQGMRSTTEAIERQCSAQGLNSDLGQTVQLVVREWGGRFSVHSVFDRGQGEDFPDSSDGQVRPLVSWAPGMSAQLRAQGDTQFAANLTAAGSLSDVLRAVGRVFQYALNHGRAMSAEVELGLTVISRGTPQSGYLRVPTKWLASAKDRALLGRIGPPPTIALFPLLDAERRLFQPITAADQETPSC